MDLTLEEKLFMEIITWRHNNGFHFSPKGKNVCSTDNCPWGVKIFYNLHCICFAIWSTVYCIQMFYGLHIKHILKICINLYYSLSKYFDVRDQFHIEIEFFDWNNQYKNLNSVFLWVVFVNLNTVIFSSFDRLNHHLNTQRKLLVNFDSCRVD